MRIDFYLRFSTQFGQQLSITGNLFSLGKGEEARALPMQFLNHEFWQASIEIDEKENESLHYQYILTNDQGERIKEGERNRLIDLKKIAQDHVVLVDEWNYAGAYENVFYTTPFQNVFLADGAKLKKSKEKNSTHIIKVKAPLLRKNETLCITGSAEVLGGWDKEKPLLLEKVGEWFVARLDLKEVAFPITYKFATYDTKQAAIARFETGDNRLLHSEGNFDALTIVHDGFVRLANDTWKGAGVAIPVFSLRSNNSFGVGEFSDINLLVDWAVQAGLKLVQILPVNDTSATFSEQDSYPYAAISAFALHPIYINLSQVAGKKFAPLIKAVNKKQKQLNSLPDVDYKNVIQFKMQLLRELYELQGDDFLKEKAYTAFFEDNKDWLKPYAAFSVLRDRNNTSEFSQWKAHSVYNEAEIDKLSAPRSKTAKDIRFYYFVQYHLHLQLQAASQYAHKKGVVLKGDIPIGIYRNGVDAWTNPELYHMCWQAGAPPDDFAVKGQNWGFPTYNWQKMQHDHFEWWRQRFHQMSNYFDAFRIDHILGFFRIWSIPMDAVEGIMGRFVPALPVTVAEFGERGIWFDYERYCQPYITEDVVFRLFGEHAEFIRNEFLERKDDHRFQLKEAFNTQRKIEAYFSQQDGNDDNEKLKLGLYDLVSNVLLFEEPGSDKKLFHFRISIEHTTSFQALDADTQHKVRELYYDYFYHRQDDFWKDEAMRKLPALKEATDMLICGEDLGMVPHCVPDVMRDLGILSLEIQRMPKNPHTEFFHPKDAPYLSVITPSTHDMSTLRGWWEEDHQRTQKFYNTILESHGEAPYFCESWINRAIVLQHLYSPAMWTVFQLQDILGMSEQLRRENPHEERINEPANPKHYWRYRMHLTLEQLLKEKSFNQELNDYIINSGR